MRKRSFRCDAGDGRQKTEWNNAASATRKPARLASKDVPRRLFPIAVIIVGSVVAETTVSWEYRRH